MIWLLLLMMVVGFVGGYIICTFYGGSSSIVRLESFFDGFQRGNEEGYAIGFADGRDFPEEEEAS